MPDINVSAEALRYAALPYRLTVQAEQGNSLTLTLYTATHPELPGCRAFGYTEAEALDNLAEVRAEYIQVLLDEGAAVPLPQVSVTLQCHDGRLVQEPEPRRVNTELRGWGTKGALC